jgi:hypothetical protein
MSPSLDRLIWNKLGVKSGDVQPMTGLPWHKVDRNILGEIFNEGGLKYGAEIGVHRGSFSLVLCKAIPGLKLLCVDPWTAYGRTSDRRMEGYYQQAITNLAGFDVKYMRMKGVEAAKEIPDGSLDFVYIDALHEFDPVMIDIITWAPKVRIGGIVSGHDYTIQYQYGVIDAVNAYVKAHSIPNFYITSEIFPSWFWVRRS